MNTKENFLSRTQGIVASGEDHALVSVPQNERQSGAKLSLVPIGVNTALAVLAIGGFTVVLSGFWNALLAGLISMVVGFVLAKLMGNLSFKTGMSSTITSRYFGVGVKGSSIGGFIYAFMLLGFLALENALLYEGTILMFNLEDSIGIRIGIYGVLTIAWILLAIFGLKLALKASSIMTCVTIMICLYMIYQIFFINQVNFSEVINSTGIVPGSMWEKMLASIALVGAIGGTTAMLTADIARFCRTQKDVTILALAGPITQNIFVVLIGGLIVVGGMPQVIDYLMQRQAGLSPEEAAIAAGGFVMSNTGAFFVVLAGWVGFITIYAAQAKAQAINAYAGSLALVNLINALIQKKVSRVLMVVVGNILALLMISAGILHQFTVWLASLGCMTFALTGVMIADFYIVRKGQYHSSLMDQVENWNWAGVITLVSCASFSIWLMVVEKFSLGFFAGFFLTLAMYPVLRKILPQGTATGYANQNVALDIVE